MVPKLDTAGAIFWCLGGFGQETVSRKIITTIANIIIIILNTIIIIIMIQPDELGCPDSREESRQKLSPVVTDALLSYQ